MSFLLPVIKNILPVTFQEAELYEPFCEQVAALHAAKLQADLMNAEPEGNEEKKTIDLDEEDKEEIVKDFLWELYSGLKKGLGEKPDEKSKFIYEFYGGLVEETYSRETISIPVYNCKLSKRKGGKTKGKENKSSEEKVVNPLSGNKVSVDGRLFKTLVKDGLLSESGEMTEKGVKTYNEVLAKRPKKIDHPTRKGKITMGGKAYQTLLEQDYFYNEETETWTCPNKEEEEEESSEEATEDMGVGEGEESEESEEKSEQATEEEEESEQATEEEEESEQATEEETSEEATEEETSEEEVVEEEPPKKAPKKARQVSEKIPHPKSKSRQIVKGGKAHQNLEADGWRYNDEEGTWKQKEKKESEE